MENPVTEIRGVITALAQGSPEQQENTLRKYFLPNASFSHPFCHVPSFSKGAFPLASNLDSLWVILSIYRWYRSLSPHIDIVIDSAAFDQRTGLLYVSIRQTFAVWFVPLYKAPVKLVSVLHLTQRTPGADELGNRTPGTTSPDMTESTRLNGAPKYFIASQEDLYQANDCLQFLLPGLGPLLWYLWQLYSTFLCVLGSLIFLPLYFLLNGSPRTKVK